MRKLLEKFNKNKIIIGIIMICIIVIIIGMIFFIQNINTNVTSSDNQEIENTVNYQYKLFKPTFKTSKDSIYDDYDFTQDMIYQEKENIYYKKIDNYNDYLIVKNRWNDILDMEEQDFQDNFMLISAIENTSMLGLTVDKIENDDTHLYVSLIKDEKFPAKEDDSINYEETCISYIIPRTMDRENIIVTRNLRNDEKDYDTQMQIAESKEEIQSRSYSFQYRDKSYRQFEEESSKPNSTIKVIPQDWKDMICKDFYITQDMADIDFDNWKSLGNGFYALTITQYSEYLKLMNNYKVKDLTWWDFKNIYAIIIVRNNSDNTIDIGNIEESENGKAILEIGPGGYLDVSENLKYVGTAIFLPNYRSLEENYLEIKLK